MFLGVPDRWEPLVFGVIGLLLGSLLLRPPDTSTPVGPAQGFHPIIDPTTGVASTLDPATPSSWADTLKLFETSGVA